MVVGPSLIEIAKIYKNDVGGFVKWCISPGQKRNGAIQMASMAHVGETNLKEIHAHILSVAKGKKEKKKASKDAYSGNYVNRETPYIQRIFLKGSGPAAIAIFVNRDLAVCWDAGATRLRYIWESKGYNPFAHWNGNGSRYPKMEGQTVYTESQGLTISGIENQTTRQFHGYKIINGFPEFNYSIGQVNITEYVHSNSDRNILRKFTITGAHQGITLNLGEQNQTTASTSSGTISDNTLTLAGAETINFTLTLSLK